MCEINITNFEEKFPEIRKNLETAKFIGLDLEFSALNPLSNCSPSLFDNPSQRYAKLKKNVEYTIPVQIGITAFQFDADGNSYLGNTYTFYIKPAVFSHIDNHFYFQSSSLQFLSYYNFDFNKFVYLGIPYLSKIEEQDLKRKFANDEIGEGSNSLPLDMDIILCEQVNIVKDWYKKAKNEESLTFPDISKQFRHNFEFKYHFHKYCRESFKDVCTFENDGIITIKKDESKVFHNSDLEKELIKNLVGFRKVYDLLISLKKPLVAHNVLMDILILLNNFEGFLPNKYYDFKKLTSKLFPVIFDTKHICYNIRKSIPGEKLWDNTDLKSLFEYFKNGTGRHLAMLSPAIKIQADKDDYFDKYHEAGWDSFCAGYIFIRMAFLKIHEEHPKSKVFMPVELLNGVEVYRNKLNVIRGSINHINLEGEDPESIRPPWFVVELNKSKKLNLKELNSTLSAYGNVEIKPLSWIGHKAIVAVDNYASCR
ncbi:hypothetical protein WA026_022175 [Henosepilachna vigintioctopunctata]|uniref:Uncharacterized protein n=1 Tax=Henosepilachna vigintioctopunctata TaxID=420089 RepID=A0AAW1TYD4_9CUCU